MMELIIEKHDLKNTSEFLDPQAEDEIIFGNFVSGHPMCFEQTYSEVIAELTRKLPTDYKIVQSNVIGTGEGTIGLMKIKN